MRKFVIEREMPSIGSADPNEFRAVARNSNELLDSVAPGVQWLQSFVSANKMYCLYLAKDEEVLRQYLSKSEFPADKINEITATIDPTSAR